MGVLDREYEFYICNKKELLKKYLNKYIVIKDNDIIGIYKEFDKAMNEALKKYKIGNFMVKQVLIEEPVIIVH